jgi:hypothetical protein
VDDSQSRWPPVVWLLFAGSLSVDRRAIYDLRKMACVQHIVPTEIPVVGILGLQFRGFLRSPSTNSKIPHLWRSFS